jgi:hypothetical protein
MIAEWFCAICTSCCWSRGPFVDSVRKSRSQAIRKDEPVKQWACALLRPGQMQLVRKLKPLEQVA